MLKDVIFRWGARIFTPHLAAHMEKEDALKLDAAEGRDVREEDYLLVEDHGYDATLFCFSGMAVLFAGMPQFEFRRILRRHNKNCNLVFIRDLARTGYHIAPDGTSDGLAFYSSKVREIMDRLGSRYNVALGASGGGTMALYCAQVCGMDHAVAFSPAILPRVYLGLGNLLRSVLDVRRMVTDFGAYTETVIVTIGGGYIFRKIARAGYAPTDLRELYRSDPPRRPRVTIFYGERCRPDAYQARAMSELPDVYTRGLDTAHHDCPAYLKQCRTLGATMRDAIQEPLLAAGAGNPRE